MLGRDSEGLAVAADRDFFVAFAATTALVGTLLSRIAEDLILWSSAECGFIDLPEAFTNGSSLMPQRKNSDALELIHGKAACLQGDLTTLRSVLVALAEKKNVPFNQ